MKGIELIKRMPLELQKEFAREFVKQKSKRKLIQYLNREFSNKFYCFNDFINDAFVWDKANKPYWQRISLSANFMPSTFSMPKSQSTKTK